jgi:hypothetical protein
MRYINLSYFEERVSVTSVGAMLETKRVQARG